MSNALALTPQSVADANTMAVTLAKSKLVPDHFRDKPSDVFMAITYGLELGMPPVTSLMAIAVIKGKPTLYASAMVALVLGSGKAVYFRCVESTGTSATYETQRANSPEPERKTFTVEDAKAAGLLGGMYSKYPKQMLEARAKAYLARDVYPDVLHGMMSAEEAQELEPDAVNVEKFEAPPEHLEEVEDAEVVADATTITDAMLSCSSMAELDGLLPDLKQLKGEERDNAKQVYAAQRKTIQGAK